MSKHRADYPTSTYADGTVHEHRPDFHDYHNSPRVEPPPPVNVEATRNEGFLAYVQDSTLAANPYNDVAEATRWSYWRDGWFEARDAEVAVNEFLAAAITVFG